MTVSLHLVIDRADPEPLGRFWAAALGYELEPPPDGFASWDAYRGDVGVPEDELGTGADCIVDPGGQGPRIWFQVVPERKAAKNRVAGQLESRRFPAELDLGYAEGLKKAGRLQPDALRHHPRGDGPRRRHRRGEEPGRRGAGAAKGREG